MWNKNIINIIFYVVVILLFALYESAELAVVSLSKLDMDADVVAYKFKVVLTFLCGIYCLFQKRPSIDFFRIVFILIMTVWVISVLHHEDSIIGYVIFSTDMLMPLVMLFYFYHVSQTISPKVFYIGLIVALLILFYTFLNVYQIMLLSAFFYDVHTSASYIFLLLLPFFLVSNNKILMWGGVVFIAALMVFSLKRGGILSFALALMVFFGVESIITKRKAKIKSLIGIILVMAIIALVVTYWLGDYFDTIVERFRSISDDGGSSRDSVYETTWTMITRSEPTSLFFGHGWNMVLEDSPMDLSAHNDFMEVIYDFGVFAFCRYLFFFYRLYKTMFRLIKLRSVNAAPFAFSVITFTINSTIAHVFIYPFNFIAVAAVWGYILGKEKTRQQVLNQLQNTQIAKR